MSGDEEINRHFRKIWEEHHNPDVRNIKNRKIKKEKQKKEFEEELCI